MLSLNQIKMLRSLGDKKQRQKYHKFIAEGEKVLREALIYWPDRVEAVFADTSRFKKSEFPLPPGCPWYEASTKDMDSVSQLHTPPGILGLMRMPETDELIPKNHSWLLYLDAISDPGNVGAIIRTADWFGLDVIVFGPGTVEWSNPKVVQAAMGSLFRVTILSKTMEEVILQNPNHSLIGADLEGKGLSTFKWPNKGILIMGSESHGLSPNVHEKLMEKIVIEKGPGRAAESLNVTVAVGILLETWRRQLQ